MQAAKTHEAAPKHTDSVAKTPSSGTRDKATRAGVNPVWQRLATHVAAPVMPATALAGMPILQLKPT